jgi:Ca-activated chloride channel family protein
VSAVTRVAFAVVLTTLGAVHPQIPSGTSVFRSGTSVVSVNVSVTDARNQFVTGLNRDDFAVYEDGVAQQIQFFEATQTPLDLIVLIDTSSSMTDKMSTVHRAATGFLGTLRKGDRGAVVAFSDRVQIIQELTEDGKRLADAVRETRPGGGTALHDALYVALRQFGGSSVETGDLRRRSIAVLSDGQDTSSLLSFDDVLELARKSGVGIYAIGLQGRVRPAVSANRSYMSQSQYALKSLSEETGAEAFFPTQISELESIYASIATELSHQYSLGYVPANGGADGKFRQIAVRIPARPELKPKARRGYIAQTASSTRH